jgi:hypothetical protein
VKHILNISDVYYTQIEMSRSRICRYNCGMELGQFDKKEKKYREASSGVLHTRERCEAMKNTMRNNSKPAMEEPQYQQQPPETEVK